MKRKIVLTFSLLMIINILVITSIAIYFVYKKNQQDIISFRKSEIQKLKDHLSNLIDIPYNLISQSYQRTQNDTFLIEYIKKELHRNDSLATQMNDATLLQMYKEAAQKKYLQEAILEISSIRFDQGKGYFWITDNQLPYPTMIMHPIRPQYNGKIMNDPKYNTERYTKKNIYQARAEICNNQGSGFIEYQINKPGVETFENKISLSKLFQPLNWVVSTGLYTDQIEEAVMAETAKMNQQVRQIMWIVFLVSLLMMGLGIWIAERFSQRMITAIHAVQERLKKLSLGQKVEKLNLKRNDEIVEMTASLNALVDGIDAYITFAKEVGSGHLETPFKTLSERDTLGNALLAMRENLKSSAYEEASRKWAAEGMANFGEILRKNNTDLKILGDEVLRFLTEYLQINQGAVYIVEDNEEGEPVLNLFACYAYNRKKYLNMEIEIGDGLVGQCYLERKSIYLLTAPEDYIHIKSGLGDASPTNVLIVPLINNEEACGVLEIASFQKLNEQEVRFVENISESLASTINAARINERTRSLLQVSQKMTEELKAQEEELRQNQEEMQSTQEEMNRKYNALHQDYSELILENETLKEQLTNPNNVSQNGKEKS